MRSIRHFRPHPSLRLTLLLLACISPAHGAPIATAPVDGYTVIAKYPHSTLSYTEGFFYLDGMFYEGTGMVGRSAVMAIDPANRQSRAAPGSPSGLFRRRHRRLGPEYL